MVPFPSLLSLRVTVGTECGICNVCWKKKNKRIYPVKPQPAHPAPNVVAPREKFNLGFIGAFGDLSLSLVVFLIQFPVYACK